MRRVAALAAVVALALGVALAALGCASGVAASAAAGGGARATLDLWQPLRGDGTLPPDAVARIVDSVREAYPLCITDTFMLGRSVHGSPIHAYHAGAPQLGEQLPTLALLAVLDGWESVALGFVLRMLAELCEQTRGRANPLHRTHLWFVPLVNADSYSFNYGLQQSVAAARAASVAAAAAAASTASTTTAAAAAAAAGAAAAAADMQPLPAVHVKNLAATCSGNRSASGVNLDRNFKFRWGELADGKWPCEPHYAGPRPLSEPESNAVEEFVALVDNTRAERDEHTTFVIVRQTYRGTGAGGDGDDGNAQGDGDDDDGDVNDIASSARAAVHYPYAFQGEVASNDAHALFERIARDFGSSIGAASGNATQQRRRRRKRRRRSADDADDADDVAGALPFSAESRARATSSSSDGTLLDWLWAQRSMPAVELRLHVAHSWVSVSDGVRAFEPLVGGIVRHARRLANVSVAAVPRTRTRLALLNAATRGWALVGLLAGVVLGGCAFGGLCYCCWLCCSPDRSPTERLESALPQRVQPAVGRLRTARRTQRAGAVVDELLAFEMHSAQPKSQQIKSLVTHIKKTAIDKG